MKASSRLMILVVALLLGNLHAEAEAADGQSPLTIECGDACDWPLRGNPEGLLQATRCGRGNLPTGPMPPVHSGVLLALDDLPTCFRPIFTALAAAIAESAGNFPAKAVVRVRIARQFYEASAYYQPRGRQVVYLPAEIEPIFDVLQREWPNYSSPSGDLAWSGFLLVVDGSDIRVRVMAEEARPGDVWLHSGEILGEFFPDLPVQPVLR